MPAPESHNKTIELLNLKSTRFDLSIADVNIATGDFDMTHAQLTLTGEDDAFTHNFEDGKLRVDENDQLGTAISQFNEHDGSSRIEISGGAIRISGIDATGTRSVTFSAGNVALRKATLLLPVNLSTSHRVETSTGDVELEHLTAEQLRVASKSGDIALIGAQVEEVNLSTMSGDVEIEDTKSKKSVVAKSMSGDIEVTRSEAPSWILSTTSGSIRVKNTKGKVNSSTTSGSSRIS